MINRKKIVFLFPGVGSQYTGMGKDLYDGFKIVRNVFEEAGDILKVDLTKMCFFSEGKEELAKLENVQCALLTLSVATFRVFMQELGIEPQYCMGHSLGEYSSLCCAGAIKFADTLEIVKQRAAIINDTAAGLEGTMIWVINLETPVVEKICGKFYSAGRKIYISAYDTPYQTSISGYRDDVMAAAEEFEKAGAIVYPLKFSGPFHCPLMQPAVNKTKSILKNYKYKKPLFTVIANRNGLPYNDVESIAEDLSRHLVSPIQWRASIEYLHQQETEIAVEIGPKNVLTFLMQKNSSSIRSYSLDKRKDLDLIKDELIIKEKEFLTVIGKCLGGATATKNLNNNSEDYQIGVVQPYRRVEAVFTELKKNGKYPSQEHVQEAVQMLDSVFKTKKVPLQEQEKRLNDILGGKMLTFD